MRKSLLTITEYSIIAMFSVVHILWNQQFFVFSKLKSKSWHFQELIEKLLSVNSLRVWWYFLSYTSFANSFRIADYSLCYHLATFDLVRLVVYLSCPLDRKIDRKGHQIRTVGGLCPFYRILFQLWDFSRELHRRTAIEAEIHHVLPGLGTASNYEFVYDFFWHSFVILLWRPNQKERPK